MGTSARSKEQGTAAHEWIRNCIAASLAAGKQADIMIVKGDPSKNIRDIDNVEIVFKDGAGYDSKKLIESVKGQVAIH